MSSSKLQPELNMNQEALRKYLRYDSQENPLLCVDKDTDPRTLAADLAEAFDTEYQMAEEIARRWLAEEEMEPQTLDEVAIEIEVATILHRLVQEDKVDQIEVQPELHKAGG